jgi:hypothetical protein
VCRALLDFAGEEGLAWPSVETLAQRARVHPTTARKHLGHLELDGVIESLGARSLGRRSTLWRVIHRAAQPERNPSANPSVFERQPERFAQNDNSLEFELIPTPRNPRAMTREENLARQIELHGGLHPALAFRVQHLRAGGRRLPSWSDEQHAEALAEVAAIDERRYALPDAERPLS